ncbi:GNAT family N-acetyltransferase [Hymenobacter sp. 15J16-1T3B]|uniref:GNAT family N-acetyltransferase n=1 Tax=Hymenobacter sp. 15J16-1T3B TaxID=2886941 RepID=UPI001D0F50A3|nr:GNAT family N-acetyltransferase [Hymenobacter sp. 15J16-1T3B]MCC3156597.1 GNAT family N-acetyltransferase [Hymenobacter sp. 15J16-1T3B]
MTSLPPLLQGARVTLRPLTPADKDLFYQWAVRSDATPFIFNTADDARLPSWEQLFSDYQPHYFDPSDPAQGQSFGILAEDRLIGQVNYDGIDPLDNSTELDIWIASSTDTSRGYGTDALNTLVEYLFRELGVEVCTIVPAASNTRAVRTYEKAGFRLAREVTHNQVRWLHMERQRPAS